MGVSDGAEERAALRPVERAPFWGDEPELLNALDRVHRLILDNVASAGGIVGEALVRYVSRPGKMLRPGFVILGSWAENDASRPRERIIRVAAAIEVLHLATLVHDDVIDDAPTRRGSPALHTLYGTKQAVLMGDYLLTRCFSLVAEGVSRENGRLLASAVGHICRGELRQADAVARPCFSRREYLRRIVQKTALLFTASLVTGATESKVSRPVQALLARIGYNVGMAFQLVDDLLDFTAQESVLGKPVGSDLRCGLHTLPVVEAIHRDPRVRALVVPPPSGASALARAVQAVVEAGGVERTRELAALYTARADRALAALPRPSHRARMARAVNRLLHRDR